MSSFMTHLNAEITNDEVMQIAQHGVDFIKPVGFHTEADVERLYRLFHKDMWTLVAEAAEHSGADPLLMLAEHAITDGIRVLSEVAMQQRVVYWAVEHVCRQWLMLEAVGTFRENL